MRWWRRQSHKRQERELDAELRDHVDRLTVRYRADGLSPEAARRRAVLEFGGVEQVKDACRDERVGGFLDATAQDLRVGLRVLRRQPGFTLAVVVTLGLGLGASAAIFSIVNAILLRPLPYVDPEGLVQVVETIPAEESPTGASERTASMNMSEFIEWQPRARTITDAAVRQSSSMTFDTSEGAVRLSGTRASRALFPMLGVEPVVGRLFEPGDERSGAEKVVLLGHSAWQTYFGGDPRIVGRSIVLDGEPYSVIGVMPRYFRPFADAEPAFWLPLAATAPPGGFARLDVVARLSEGTSLDAAAAEARTIFGALRGYSPSEPGPAFDVVRWQDQLVRPIRPALVVLAGAVSLVLMIACLNVINLFLARSTARRQELAVRVALGAGRSRLVRQFAAEGLLLTAVAAAVGLALAVAGIRMLRVTGQPLPRPDLMRLDVAGSTIPRLDEIAVDGSAVLYTLALASVMGAFFAIAPALRAWRMQRIQAGEAIPRAATGLLSTRNILVLCQVSLTVLLLTGAGLLIRSFVELTRVDVGYDPSDVITFQTLPGAFGPAGAQEAGRRFLEDLVTRLAAIPGVQAAAFTSGLPMVQSKFMLNIGSESRVPGASLRGGHAFVVSRGYFAVLHVPLVAGRTFTDGDRSGQPRAFVINRTLAVQYFGSAEAVGKPLVAWGLPGQVVGVVADVRQLAVDRSAEPQLFMDARQVPAGWPVGFQDGVYVGVRTATAPGAIIQVIRQVVRDLDPKMPIDGIATMEALAASSVTRPRADAALMGIFAAVALILAAVGVYGVVAYFAAQRTREIGIRVALGAPKGNVLALVLRQAMAMTAAGLALGVLGALGATRYLDGMLYGIRPFDAFTFAGVVIVLGAVATAAAWMPARRAAAVDPVVALRYE